MKKDVFLFLRKKTKLSLILIILLSLTFVFIGVYDLVFNYKISVIPSHSELLEKEAVPFIQIVKTKDEKGKPNFFGINFPLSDEDIKQVYEQLPNSSLANVYQISRYHIPSNVINYYEMMVDLFAVDDDYFLQNYPYQYRTYNLDIVELNDFSHLENNIIGTIPKEADEVLISNRLADFFIEEGIRLYEKDTYFYPTDYEDLINYDTYFYFDSFDKIKIIGIINYDLSEYNLLKDKTYDTLDSNYSFISSKLSNYDDTIYNKIFVTPEFISNLKIDGSSLEDNNSSNYVYKVVQTGILVGNNMDSSFFSILKKYNMNNSLTAITPFTNEINNLSIFSEIPFISIVLIGIILLLLIISMFILRRILICKELSNTLNNKKVALNITEIAIISIILSFLILLILANLVTKAMVDMIYSTLNPFILSFRQLFIFGFVIVCIIGLVILIIKLKEQKNCK